MMVKKMGLWIASSLFVSSLALAAARELDLKWLGIPQDLHEIPKHLEAVERLPVDLVHDVPFLKPEAAAGEVLVHGADAEAPALHRLGADLLQEPERVLG